MDLTRSSACEIAALIRRKALSPVEVVQATLDRIEACAEVNAFVTVTTERALAAARSAEQAVMAGDELGPLHGVPYSVKDLLTTGGVRTTMGSVIFEDFVPLADAVAVRRAETAGAILVGKTTTPEFGHKPVAMSPVSGRTLNPINPERSPGGSSCGAAAALAAGMGPLALGTDGGGSIRIPASCCGVVGLKPTLGVVPHLQVPDLFSANSYVGPMARDVADMRLLFDTLRGFDDLDPYGQHARASRGRGVASSLRGLKVAWLPSAGNPVDPQVLRATEAALRFMEGAGAVIETVQHDFVSLEAHFLVLLRSLLAARVGPHLARFGDRLDPTLLEAVHLGQAISAVQLHEANAARSRCFGALQLTLAQHDLIVSPTLSAPPLPISLDLGGPIHIAGRLAGTVRAAWYPYTYPMNLTGHPALSLPCGHDDEGLPIGLQLVGRWYDEDFLLSVAALVEAGLGPWHRGLRLPASCVWS